MTVCYVITSGEYSDYRIQAVFSTQELAQSALRHYNDAQIEEFSVDPDYPTRSDGLIGYQCYGWSDMSIRPFPRSLEEMSRQNTEKVRTLDGTDTQSIYVWAKDHDHAIKIASEKFAQQRAIDAGIA